MKIRFFIKSISLRLLAVMVIGLMMNATNSAAAMTLSAAGTGVAAPANSDFGSGQPDFGPNVMIFDPSMPTSQIQTAVDAIANQQVPNQFGSQRYALLFKPGTYGSSTAPLNF